MGIGATILIWVAIAIVVIIIFSSIVGTYNMFINLKNDISRAWSNIDVLLKQRTDELPNLIESVKGYMKHEKGVFEEITRARTAMMGANTLSEKAKASNQITDALKTIFAVAENYPKLKANENFLKLQERITGIENEIADRREFYNSSVTNFNIKAESFPDLILAKMFNFTKKDLFSATEDEKKVVDVKFA